MADHIRKARYAASEASNGQDLPLTTASDFETVPDFVACDNHENSVGRMAEYDRGNRLKHHGRLCDECLREVGNDIFWVASESYIQELRRSGK